MIEVQLSSTLRDEILTLDREWRLLIADHLERFATNWRTCTRMAYPPAGVGLRTGFWVVRADDTCYLIQLPFRWLQDESIAFINRIIMSEVVVMPSWIRTPSECYDDQPPFTVIRVAW